ncbi:IgGFc-binding protein [Nannocystaceae bacterium ST9]
MLAPGETHVFLLDPELTEYAEQTSQYRSGAVQHVVSDLPIVAYLHSPYEGSSTNGSSLLLPEHVLRNDYVVYGYPAYVTPSYFIVIAMEDQTTLRWTPSVETAGDSLPLPYVEGGQIGEQLLNRFDNVRIDTSQKLDRPPCEQDLSGTVVSADKPIWVMSAVRGLRVPYCATDQAIPGCAPPAPILAECQGGSDFVQEQNLPLETWGQLYVGPASPVRDTENHYWRVYSGADDVTIDVEPPQPGSPFVLANRGDYFDLEVPTGTDLVFDGDGPFMPVQYTAGHYAAGDVGSPAMVQMVPIEQFLDRYVFVTGFSYDRHYVQVIRPAGAATIVLDGATVTTWTSVGAWEIATVPIVEGAHEIHGDVSFGIIQYGYSTFTNASYSAGYAYPGGMLAETIFIP